MTQLTAHPTSPFQRLIPPDAIRDRYQGCLLGGAVGDALGAPVEFLPRTDILARFGPQGIVDFAPAYGKIGAITDDTQMTLFTAEGILRANLRADDGGFVHTASIVHHALLRWYRSQGGNPALATDDVGLVSDQRLSAARRKLLSFTTSTNSAMSSR